MLLTVCAAGTLGAETCGTPQQRWPQYTRALDGSEAMFTTMCLLYTSGFEVGRQRRQLDDLSSADAGTAKAQKGPAVEAAREFYRQHRLKDPGATLSRYIWFGLVSGPAPDFQPMLDAGSSSSRSAPTGGIQRNSVELLQRTEHRHAVEASAAGVQPGNRADCKTACSQIVMVSTAYLRDVLNPAEERTFNIIVDPLVGRITNVRNFGDHYAIILSGAQDVPIDVVRHAFLHFLAGPAAADVFARGDREGAAVCKRVERLHACRQTCETTTFPGSPNAWCEPWS